MVVVLWIVLWGFLNIFLYIYIKKYALWCLCIKATYGLLWTDFLIPQYAGDESQRLVPQHCGSRATHCPCLPRVERWAGCYASVDTGHALNTEQHTVTRGGHSDMVTRLK